MKLIDRLTASAAPESRMTWEDYLGWIDSVYGSGYGDGGAVLQQTYRPSGMVEPVGGDFASYIATVYKRNGPVFALMAFRATLFAQVRWQFQQMSGGRPGDLFGTPDLELLNGNASLNVRMIQDADLAGSFYGVLAERKIRRLRPDWVQVIADRPLDEYDAEIVGYAYMRGGPTVTPLEKAETFLADQVVHWAPSPDPEACYRGMSWLTPVLREIRADDATTVHKAKFFEHGATPNMVVKLDAAVSFENFMKFKEDFDDQHKGVRNAYKTLFLGGGADATVVGSDMKQLEFKVTQGAGESRLAAAANVPAVLVGFSEGLAAATYSNFSQARRRFADGTLHPLWVSAAAALANVVRPPGAASRLWYDGRDVPFLREDAKDNASIRREDAATIRTLVDAGYLPDTVTDAVLSGDFKRLKHSGLFSVQLQEPGSQQPNGNGNGKEPATVVGGK